MIGKSHKKFAINTAAVASLVTSAAAMSFTVKYAGLVLIPILWVPLAPLGGLLSDIDKRGTTIRKQYDMIIQFILPLLLTVLGIQIVLYYRGIVDLRATIIPAISIAVIAILQFILVHSSHRKQTHSLLFVFLNLLFDIYVSRYLAVFNPLLGDIVFSVMFGKTIGVLSHIIVDQFNVKRQSWFYPIDEIIMKFINKNRSEKNSIDLRIPTIGKVVTGTNAERTFIIFACAVEWLIGITILYVLWRKNMGS